MTFFGLWKVYGDVVCVKHHLAKRFLHPERRKVFAIWFFKIFYATSRQQESQKLLPLAFSKNHLL